MPRERLASVDELQARGALPRDALLSEELKGEQPAMDFRASHPPGWLGTRVLDLLARRPFSGRAQCLALHEDVASVCDFAVCVPVCNEEGLLPATLSALEVAVARVPHRQGAAVFVVNDTTDASIAILAGWARRTGHHAVIAELEFDQAIRCAPFSRRLALDVGALLAPDGALLTTDADTCVHRDWLASNLAILERQDALVCGSVALDAADLDRLPVRVHECGALEREYGRATGDLWQLWTGEEQYPLPVSALGASLALRASCYRQVGGLPTPASGEDKALARLVRKHGYPVIGSDEARVVTSGRTRGRTPGGVSDALLERMTNDDPACDEDLIPITLLRRRADLWNRLTGQPDAAALFLRLCREGIYQSTARMHRRAVARELAIAQSLLCRPAARVAEARHA